jgi:NAD(P)-dependent dehydrogenase (short-subunit alcohol dehydrogenase family)
MRGVVGRPPSLTPTSNPIRIGRTWHTAPMSDTQDSSAPDLLWPDLGGRVAVVTGGGTGMGRELCRQLAELGAHVATCDVSADTMAETVSTIDGVRTLTHLADVSDEAQVLAFRDAVASEFGEVHLLFNNAGIGGGGSIVNDGRAEWEATFGVCWGGVYHGTRAFLPLLLAADQGHVVNTSSVNGFWASLGPNVPHTAYSAAKFAVKGFTEALVTDFRQNAPHLHASVVMPGHIGTSIALNSMKAHGRDPKEMTADQLDEIRTNWSRRGIDLTAVSDEDLRTGIQQQGEMFRDLAPMTAAQAAEVIIAAVRRGEWRILVGHDAEVLDALVREHPTEAYSAQFVDRLRAAGLFQFMN